MSRLPILLLHGALGSKTQLEPLKSLLTQEGKAVYSMNFSGHGDEPIQSGFGIETFSDDVINFLNQHALKQVDLFGYSMGGYVAVWLAYHHPERVGKIVTLGTKFDWSPESAAKEIKKLNPEKILEKIPAFARILEHRHTPNDWKQLMQRTCDMMSGLGERPLLTKEILETISLPITILLGDQDDMADRNYSETVASWLPIGSFKLLNSTPHPIEKVNLSELIPLFFTN